MHLIIVAGGIGSRLAPLTNHIPKFLVNIGKQTGYVEQINYWQDCLTSLTVIVHSNYEQMIKEYHKLYFPDIKLIVKTVDVANGSAHAIISTCQHLEGERDVYFQWCDVMPADPLDLHFIREHQKDRNVVFTNYDHPNRYGLAYIKTPGGGVQPMLQEDGRGGVFGLYRVGKYTSDIQFTDGQDFVEVIKQFGPLDELTVSKIVDWGDMPKLNRTRETADAAREFNKVEFQGELVLKSATNKQGETLIAREMNWYNAIEDQSVGMLNKPNVPKVWIAKDRKSFVMSKVNGIPVYQIWPTLDAEARALVLERLITQMRLLHSMNRMAPTAKDILQRDLKIEAYDKLLSRYRQIKGVIDSFGQITHVNQHRLREQDPEVTIQRLYAKLVDTYAGAKSYTLIHGDLQMSNTMINPDTLEVSIIDPRGYFGESQLYGHEDYDISKLLYSLSGYDLFNYSKDFHINKVGSILEFTIPKPDLSGCESIINETFWEHHYLWLAVIWIGLAAYIRNDPVKSVAAHYHGLALAERVLAGTIDRLAP